MNLAVMWLQNAVACLEKAQDDIDKGEWAWACFASQQAVETALKAVLLLKEGSNPSTHSIRQLLSECAPYDSGFERFTAQADFVGQMYTGARYVDGAEIPLLPSQRYSEADAVAAFAYAEEILALAQAQFPSES